MNNIILVGNPNVGKTTLYNTMTKAFEKASNWHGVTVDTISKSYNYGGKDYNVTDVPGMYSLSGYSSEEKIASDYLSRHSDDLIVCICDANNLKRNIKLAVNLIANHYNVLVALNMCGEAKYNIEKIGKLLGTKIIEIDARKTASVNVLKQEIKTYFDSRKISKNVNLSQSKQKNINLKEIYSIIDSAGQNPYKTSDKIDKIVLNKWIFLPIFVSVILLIFYLTFGIVGSTICAGFSFLVGKIFGLLELFINSLNISSAIKLFFTEGVFGAISTVANFIPQIVLLMFFLNLLEDMGAMSRVAFMFDGMLKKIGLTGKSLFSLMMGYGCTASAVMTTRNLENKNLKKRTALLLPFMSCTAKLPVFLVIASLFFERYKFLIVFALYVLAILVGLVLAKIYKKAVPDKNDIFILEMPKYRLPNLKKILSDTWIVIRDFLIKVGTMILLFSSVMWVLQNFSLRFEFLNGERFESSILYFLASKLTPIFVPIGLGQAGVVAALLLGIVAKELVVVGLAMMNGVTGSLGALSQSLVLPGSVCSFTPASSIVFLVFILLYSPCISALTAIKSEFGRKTAVYVFVAQFIISYIASGIAYLIFKKWTFVFVLLAIIVVDILAKLVLKLLKKKKTICRGNCNACRKV